MSLSEKFNSAVEIRETLEKGKAGFAVLDINANEKFGFFEGKEVGENNMHAIHLGGKLIYGPGKKLSFLSHSCDANAYFKDRERWLYAKRDITKGEEVTIDYFDTESEITEPFECKCHATNCRGYIGQPTAITFFAQTVGKIRGQRDWQEVIRKKKARLCWSQGYYFFERNQPGAARASWARSLRAKFSRRVALYWAVTLVPERWVINLRPVVRRIRRWRASGAAKEGTRLLPKRDDEEAGTAMGHR